MDHREHLEDVDKFVIKWKTRLRKHSTVSAFIMGAHRRFRGIELKGVKIYDLQKVTFSTLFKLYIAGLGVLIKKRYHMLG